MKCELTSDSAAENALLDRSGSGFWIDIGNAIDPLGGATREFCLIGQQRFGRWFLNNQFALQDENDGGMQMEIAMQSVGVG